MSYICVGCPCCWNTDAAEAVDEAVDEILAAIEERYRYWDRAAAVTYLDQHNAVAARHETWAVHRLVSAKFGRPPWDPTPSVPKSPQKVAAQNGRESDFTDDAPRQNERTENT